jgi:hypothetical protein
VSPRPMDTHCDRAQVWGEDWAGHDRVRGGEDSESMRISMRVGGEDWGEADGRMPSPSRAMRRGEMSMVMLAGRWGQAGGK